MFIDKKITIITEKKFFNENGVTNNALSFLISVVNYLLFCQQGNF